MKGIDRRHLVASALALVICARSKAAQSQLIPFPIPVYDGTRWLEMFTMLKDVTALTGKIRNTLSHVQNAAAGLGGGNLVDDILLGHRRLTSDISSIGYSIDTITTQFETVFPNREAAADVAPSDVDTLRTGWHDEIQQSALAASRAQSALSTIERNTASAQAILEQSKATAGEAGDEGSRLAKLQALVQMLGVLNSDLATIATTIAATDRVNASVGAAQASDEEVEAAKAQRIMRDYARAEPIPDVEHNLLGW